MLPSYLAAPILAECGPPSGRTVPRKEDASASAPASSRSRARFHGSGSVADVLSRLVVAVGSRLGMSLRPHRDRELIAGRRFHSRRASTSNPSGAPASDDDEQSGRRTRRDRRSVIALAGPGLRALSRVSLLCQEIDGECFSLTGWGGCSSRQTWRARW